MFPDASTEGAMQCVTINTTVDTLSEEDETFTVVLTTQDPDIMLGNNVTTVTIVDNEGEPELSPLVM